MTIRVWQSFSCNNSSSYRLVARFADAAVAAAVGRELATFFEEYAREVDARRRADDTLPASAQALVEKYGIDWTDGLDWGGGGPLAGNEPEVLAQGNVLVAYHDYCLGFAAIPAFLQARDAHEVEKYSRIAPPISLVFRYEAGTNHELEDGLARLFARIARPAEESPLPYPWPMRRRWAKPIAGFRDAHTVGLYLPMSPGDLASCKRWLADRGIDRPALQLCEYADAARFAAIASARCTACEGDLEYWDPRLHDIETAQLVCRGCGGLYELSTFVGTAP